LASSPYGYLVNADGRFTPGDPERMAVVQWLFATFSQTHATIRHLVLRLKERAAPAPGRGWTMHAVHTILANDIYTGTFRGKVNAHPPLIGADTFAAAATKLSLKK
jgi:hypothetical protein